MDFIKYFKSLFESIEDSKKIVLITLSFKNAADLLKDCGFLKCDINGLNKEFNTNLMK